MPLPPPAESFEEDRSYTNCSSIAFSLEWCGLKCLFLGDAWPSVIQEAVSNGEIFDVLKLSHHGARGSTSPELLGHLAYRHVLCSSDGSRGHPSLDALLWVVSLQQKPLTLHFNYPNNAAQRIAEPLLTEKWGHHVEVSDGERLRLVLTTDE